ncbi:MAG: radical SAM protein [Desulfosarcinaceae bacterium]
MNRVKKWMGSLYHFKRFRSALNKMEHFPISQERLVYQCPLNESKRRNLTFQQINRPLLKHLELAYPHILHVGVTTLCNLRCPACPTGTASLGRPGGHLDFDVFRRTVDSLRDYLLFMLFWDWGEPMLHPRLPDMIAHAAKSQIRTVISTNGNVKCSEERIEHLISAQPSTMIVCVDGADQETYQSYRMGGRLEVVLQTIRRLANAKEKMGAAHPLIEVRSLATRHTEHQMPTLLKLAQDSGADLFTVKTLRPYNYRGSNLDETFVPESEKLSRYCYKGSRREARLRTDFLSKGALCCAKPLYAPTLNSDGTLAFCSYAQHGDEFFGSVKNDEIKTVWNSCSSRDRRVRFLRAGGTLSCRTCFFRGDHAPTIIHQVPLHRMPDGIEVEAPQTPESFLERVAGKSPER